MTAAQTADLIQTAEVCALDPDALHQLEQGLGGGPFALVVLFVSPDCPAPAVLCEALSARLPDTAVIGCTTSGEIGTRGYREGMILALGFPARHFAADTLLLDYPGQFEAPALTGRLFRARSQLAARRPDWSHELAFGFITGLNQIEDSVLASLAPALGGIPYFGGSAGDGRRYEATQVFRGGQVSHSGAVLAVLRSDCPMRVFKLDHFRVTGWRLVVTAACPVERRVTQINGTPAGQEYARLLGLPTEALSPRVFAENPLAVRIGGQHHVRSIRQMTAEGDLLFHSAIDEGLVLSLARPTDLAEHLEHALNALAQPVAPAAILACDCVLRRIEMRDRRRSERISALFRAHRVTGIVTLGEQYHALHTNQTLTGVAIYRPGASPAAPVATTTNGSPEPSA